MSKGRCAVHPIRGSETSGMTMFIPEVDVTHRSVMSYYPHTAEELGVPRSALPRSRMSTGGRAPRKGTAGGLTKSVNLDQ